MIELRRTELLQELQRMSRSGSLLVVGGPGAGKSWLLRQFAAQRESAADAVLLLLAEEHNYVESLHQLEESLRTTAGIIPTLRAYKGHQKFLILDSLDALRAEASQRVFRQLIRQVHRELPDWRIIASIRSFDARESLELQRLFPASEGELTGLRARHLEVPVFNDVEIEEAKQQDMRLAPIFASASLNLREILRNAFNLWLVIHLLNENVGIDWLYEIESEVQLFERYWRYRISVRDDAHDRLSILNGITSEMVNNRTLSVALGDAYKLTGASRTFQSLLSDEVLHRTQTNRVTYAHNILFDFSVSKLLLDEERVFGFLSDPERSIFFRPSVSYFLALLWYVDRSVFWRAASRFFDPALKLPSRVHVLPGMTVANSATQQLDFASLFALPQTSRNEMALSILRAVQAFNGMSSRRANLWLHLIVELSSRLSIVFLNEFIALIEAAGHERNWTKEQRHQLAEASIRLLTWMWQEANHRQATDDADQLLDIAAGRVIPVVTRLFSADPKNVKASLRIVLDRIGRPDVSVREVYAVANSLENVIDSDPAFAVDVYAAAFAYKETSQKRTQIGGSKVLVMTSTRAQDYSMTYYILGVRFNYFLERDLTCATLAAIRSVAGDVKREHIKPTRRLGGYSTHFTYAGVRSRLLADRSELWDHGYRDNVSLQILDALLSWVSDRLKQGELTEDAAWMVFKSIAKENQFPVVWKRLIERAAHSPELLPFTFPLLQTPEILAAPETTVVAGDLIGRSFKSFAADEKQKIEAAIWAVPDVSIAKMYRSPMDQRDRLLACIPEDERSGRATDAVEAAKSAAKPIANEPFLKFGAGSYGPVTNEDWLRQRGADTSAEPNRRLLEAKAPLAAFETKYLNEIPSAEEIATVTPLLRSAFDLTNIQAETDERVLTDVLASVSAVAESIVKNGTLDRDSATVRLSREIITKAAEYPHPEPSENADASFDTPMWGSTPKIEAAQGAMHYTYNWGVDEDLAALITKLSKDKSPAVRFQIATGLGGVYKCNTELFWQLADSMRSGERATGVLVALSRVVGHAYIARREPARVVTWLSALLKRGVSKRRSEDVFEVIFDTLMYLYIYVHEQSADRVLRSFEKSPVRYAKQLQIMANSASYYLDYNVDSFDSTAREIRARAREVELRILTAVDQGFQGLEKRSETTRGTAQRAETIKHLLQTVDRLVFRLYLIIKANPNVTRPDEKSLSEAALPVFFEESGKIWDALVSADTDYRRPMGPSTAHHLMESFNRLLPFNPGRVLSLAWRLVTGRTFGYQFDQMAITEFVRFADKILSDYKDVLRLEVNAVHFAEILDVFVSAGWPEATRLVLRMDAAVR